ncbi:TPA: hypothetical protein NKA80_004438 [Vibrio parahaemolyticus]|nr:hypothetical protein [Vibrio parahaemolyticus]
MTTVTKSNAELYRVRHNTCEGWGDVILICGKESVSVMINSDYGSFSHVWIHCGCEPKAFLCDMDFHYTMKKLSNYNLYIDNPQSYPAEIKERIIVARRHDENLTKEEAREAWEDMLNTEHSEGDLFFKELIDHPLFGKVFGDYEYLPSAKMIDPHCQDLWDRVWTPFIKQLKEELAA